MIFHKQTSYIHPESTITGSFHDTYIRLCRLHSLISLYPIDNISHHHHTPFAWLIPKVDSTEYFYFFDDCLFSYDVPSIPKYISTKAHMYIHSYSFDHITLLQKYLLPIIFDYDASVSISPHKMYFMGTINTLP